jgi:hypothetical protein
VASGLTAGAAGVTALNFVSYVDMLSRGRPSSDMPAQVVDKVAGEAGVTIPGNHEGRTARRTALGALSGMATGTAVAVAASLVRRYALRLPQPIEALADGALAMALTDGPAARLGVTDPAQWAPQAWISDIAPHLAFGMATSAVLRRLDR